MKIYKLSDLKSILKFESIKYGSRCILKSFFKDPRFRINFWLRFGSYLSTKNFFLKNSLLRLIKNKLTIKYGFDTTFDVHIDEGLRIVHLGSIVVHGNSVVGKNFTILNNVTLGQAKRMNGNDVPKVGDNVYIGVNSVLIGDIKVGDNVTIGAFSLVNKSVEDNCVIAGIPFKFIM